MASFVDRSISFFFVSWTFWAGRVRKNEQVAASKTPPPTLPVYGRGSGIPLLYRVRSGSLDIGLPFK